MGAQRSDLDLDAQKAAILLYRMPHSGDINLIKYHKFSIEKELPHLPEGGLPKGKLAAAGMQTSADSVIGMAFVGCRSI